MDGTFNAQILVEKLAKLNSSQQSIETLSHWCIFHRKNANQVVETWDKQFHCSPREQWVSFLYLANDILQNSRRKGFEFVGEFWKVLPDALNDVFKNGDDFGRNAVLRLVAIWEERKVFGSRGQILKEDLLGKNMENRTRDGKAVSYKLKQPCGDILDKLITSYKHVNDELEDEEALLARCQSTINLITKVEKEVEGDLVSLGESGVEELQGQHHILRECIQQLMSAESSRTTLASLLNEAIHEQEIKLERIRKQRQIAESRFENIGNVFQRLLSCSSGQMPTEQGPKETSLKSSDNPILFTEAQASAGDEEQLTPIRYHPGQFPENSAHTKDENRKIEAAEVAAKLTASTSSAQMLSFALSSLASECGISQSAKEDHSSDIKRQKLENGTSPYLVPHQPPPPPYPHPDSLHQPPPPSLPPSSMIQTSHPLQTPPPLHMTMTAMSPPSPATQFMQTAGSLASMSYTYGLPVQRTPSMPGYPMNGLPPYPGPPSAYHNFQASEGVGLYTLPPLPAPPSVSRQ